MVAFGNLYVWNSDLVERWSKGLPVRHPIVTDPRTFFVQYYYGRGPQGYTDLSVYEQYPQKGSD